MLHVALPINLFKIEKKNSLNIFFKENTMLIPMHELMTHIGPITGIFHVGAHEWGDALYVRV